MKQKYSVNHKNIQKKNLKSLKSKNKLKPKYSKKRQFGNKGEDVAAMFLMKQGYRIIFRNYLKKFGEIDIVAEYKGIVHFIEVKTVSCERTNVPNQSENVTYSPEEKIGYEKKLHMKRVIETFIIEFGLHNSEIFVDLIIVNFYKSGEVPRINFIENIII